ncbi:MAG: hypothetical protein R2826_01820 [Thermoleophilia bacterium]
MPDVHSDDVAWNPVDGVETRKFRCEIIEDEADAERGEPAARLQLVGSPDGRVMLVIRVPVRSLDTVRKELRDRGYRGTLPVRVRGTGGYGTWLGYLNELEVAHIVVELLEWTLTPQEQGVLDAVDDYGRRAPTGFRSPRLR